MIVDDGEQFIVVDIQASAESSSAAHKAEDPELLVEVLRSAARSPPWNSAAFICT